MATTTSPAESSRAQLTVLTACCAPAQAAVADENAQALADMFKALADPARVKIMAMLLTAEEVCACDISEGIGKSAATASHHLKILRDAGLAISEKRGTWVYYRAVPGRLAAVVDALSIGR
ncbi:metalloregulator ArsR/SmtB family transcription factor [Knoellia sp. 3-2P3]|uniref:ArsR/SmtB family transcription factor n=1 Tax=unclassified Knoellia TaxID=2618719 RepID=UPI0023DA5D99|nr:metalloregulator ArsR/SmtB family transcription factor [Knoellia sp. 3-2P3]MDF2094228.1 metalloregulator ArsR/SmtB family transcription factor [Knoellia sp. 3-2P3]